MGPPLYFGIAPPADLIADQAAIKRNATDYEDQEAVALSFIIRISARVTRASFLFMEQPAQRTTARLEGFTKARAGSAETMLGALVTIAQGMKPANARLLSAAIRDTSDAWAASILPGDRPTILDMPTCGHRYGRAAGSSSPLKRAPLASSTSQRQ